MEVWLATGNKGKVNEFKMLFKEIPDVQIHLQSEIMGFTPRPEDGKTFLENAQIKAKTLKSVKPGTWIIADDSGLVVDGLGGLPGIHSARYAGPKASDSENVAKLLKMMQIKACVDSPAQFVCSLVVYTPQGEEWNFSGELKGKISRQVRGQLGFGYDPVFVPEGQTQTLAEIGPGYKNQFSHRAIAMKSFLERLKTTL